MITRWRQKEHRKKLNIILVAFWEETWRAENWKALCNFLYMLLMLVLHVIEICSKGFSSISTLLFYSCIHIMIYLFYLLNHISLCKQANPDWAPLHVLWSDTQMQFKSFHSLQLTFARKSFHIWGVEVWTAVD